MKKVILSTLVVLMAQAASAHTLTLVTCLLNQNEDISLRVVDGDQVEEATHFAVDTATHTDIQNAKANIGERYVDISGLLKGQVLKITIDRESVDPSGSAVTIGSKTIGADCFVGDIQDVE